LKISNSDDIINSIIPSNSNLIDSNTSDNLNTINIDPVLSEVVENQNFIVEPLDLSGEPEATLNDSFSELTINQTPEASEAWRGFATEKEKEKRSYSIKKLMNLLKNLKILRILFLNMSVSF
jgi:hypothetical protein